jgi:predicted CXXCH cytochrome family protein
MLSTCWRASQGRIECLTCHNPHVSVYSPDRPADAFRQACLGCHEVGACAAPAAARRATSPLADDCVACHMRRAEPDDQRFTAFTDHWIRRDIEVDAHEKRRSHAVEPLDPSLLASFPRGEQAYYEARAYHLMAAKVPHHEREPYHRDALAAYQRALDAGFEVAESWYYLGKMHEELRDMPAARDAFARAVERDPAYYDARFALAQSSAALGDAARARAIYEAMLAERPDDPMVLSEAGRLYFAAGERDRALTAFDRAVALEPWNATLFLNRAMVLAAARRFDLAAGAIESAVRLDPDSTKLWDVYGKVMGELGRPEQVSEARAQIARLEQAARTNPFAGRYAGPLMGGGMGSSP